MLYKWQDSKLEETGNGKIRLMSYLNVFPSINFMSTTKHRIDEPLLWNTIYEKIT